jgi:hypothetical protein
MGIIGSAAAPRLCGQQALGRHESKDNGLMQAAVCALKTGTLRRLQQAS